MTSDAEHLDTIGIEHVLLERTSTNCGENVTLARDLAFHHGLRPRTVAHAALLESHPDWGRGAVSA